MTKTQGGNIFLWKRFPDTRWFNLTCLGLLWAFQASLQPKSLPTGGTNIRGAGRRGPTLEEKEKVRATSKAGVTRFTKQTSMRAAGKPSQPSCSPETGNCQPGRLFTSIHRPQSTGPGLYFANIFTNSWEKKKKKKAGNTVSLQIIKCLSRTLNYVEVYKDSLFLSTRRKMNCMIWRRWSRP